MNVSRFIIHELEKEVNSTLVNYKSSDNLINIDPSINNLIMNVHAAFERSITTYSKFNTSNTTNAVFSNSLRYLDKGDDNVFIHFSKASLGELAQTIEREPFATGGYYLFVDYEVNSYRYISIIIVRNKEAFNIQWNKNSFSVGATENINIDKLAMGFRLNCNYYLNEEENRNYLGLVSNQGDNLSKYFVKWVNADKVTSNQVNTNLLINAIKDLGPIDDTTDKDEFERQVFDYLTYFKKQNNNTINIDDLSQYFYGDPFKIRNYTSEKFKTEIDPIFKPYAKELNRLIRLRATTKGISVSIDTEKFDDDEVKIKNGTLIIANKAIVESIQKQRERLNE